MKKEEQQLREKMFVYLEKKYSGVIPPNITIQQMLDTAYSFKEAEKQFNDLKQFIKLSKKTQILDVGCGFGYFVSFLIEKGYKCQGYEIEKELVDIAYQLLKINRQDPSKIKFVKGKKLPFKAKSFDFINLHFVLDYVSDISSLMFELARILKDDGQIFITAPNYQCCYNPVYMAVFMPWFPKWFNRFYFKLIKRPNTVFLESLTFITPRYCEKIFKKLGLETQNLSLISWENLISGKNLKNRSNCLKIIVKTSRKLGLTRFLRFLGKVGFYTPLIYLLKKQR